MLSGMICKTFKEREETKNNEAPLFFLLADNAPMTGGRVPVSQSQLSAGRDAEGLKGAFRYLFSGTGLPSFNPELLTGQKANPHRNATENV